MRFPRAVAISIFESPEEKSAGVCLNQLKEIVMIEAPQLEVVELGDAVEETKGRKDGNDVEANQNLPYRVI